MTSKTQIENYIKGKSIGYVDYLPHHEKTDKHLVIYLSRLGLTIEYGNDPFIYSGMKRPTNINKWYVFTKDRLFIDKGYIDYKDAINETIESLIAQKKDELFYLESIKQNGENETI